MDPYSNDELKNTLLPKKKVVAPVLNHGEEGGPAVDLIRDKINAMYTDEPDAKEELAEAEDAGPHPSKHQKYMTDLSSSGKSLAEIQTAWHDYYVSLPDKEKHEVWQEFYEEHGKGMQHQPEHHAKPAEHHTTKPHHTPAPATHADSRSVADVKSQLLGKVQTRSKKLKKNTHFRSLLFGLSMGAITILILLFSFFNERFIAPFITPSKSVSNTPIIIDPASTAVGPEPKVIIPKINVDIPVVYDEPSINEAAVQKALEKGVLHYATTPNPGEIGNGVIFGHSSNNILNKGEYKFAFVLLNRLETGDTFMVQKDGKRYIYRVFDKKVVKPTDTSVLGPSSKPSTFTLITCDPPGTSINRLVVTGEQISPDPNANIASTVNPTDVTSPAQLPSDSPSLWERITGWFTS